MLSILHERLKICFTSLITFLILMTGIGIVYWHDGVGQLTKIADINENVIPKGTLVIVKGNFTHRTPRDALLGGVGCTVSDRNHSIRIYWLHSLPSLNSIVVVKGAVHSNTSLINVTFFETVWIFN
jgi:hypothetical protein